MVRECERDGCTTHPCYNTRGGKKGRFCKGHAEPGMDVKHPTCERDGCTARPSYNSSGQKHARFCAGHAEPGMVDVVHPTCERDGCTAQPSYNTLGKKKGRFCVGHAEPGMVDVKNPTCEHDGCTKVCNGGYGLPGYKATRCAEHKLDGYMKKSKTTCATKACKEQAVSATRPRWRARATRSPAC